MAPYEPGRPGRSTVYVAYPHHYTRLLGLDGICWQRNALCVREADLNTRSVCADVTSDVFIGRGLHVLSTATSDRSVFAAIHMVTFSCSSIDATAFAIAFDGDNDYRYRVCFKVTSVVHCVVGINRFENVVVRFTLRAPPFVFVGDRTVTDEDRIWPLADAAYRWKRSDDPSPNGAFGYCRCYHLVLADGVDANDIVPVLTRFGVTDIERAPAVPVYAGVLSPPPTDWAYGHAFQLQHLSFALRYALHVLLSQEALVLERSTDAATVTRMLSHTSASATSVLGFLHSSLRGPPDTPPNLYAFGRQT
ncbi:hypothetical protein SDRG_12035 [Saprolegnia diclina VS20]|uniref:Uncharacterized protein n=1 Tax=Saprolegnia diclina (strain VS20) TaxID=1156394 RepID=T0RD60_SAPDV|nr:hypothetical protein SDRG_12035 [Saprolegnia diclina VS20]EQC30183.1 hypothetical protein SDRG_12035 [Saprolegnia diclina VS20]|eukprot:XP_008616315.1 hypothetical protein SDRG_12035 [Saprolegnia diclina VS20]